MRLALFTIGASLPLLIGGIVGAFWSAPERLVAHALGFATGALTASLAFELVGPAYRVAGAFSVLLTFSAGALVFVVVDTALDRRMSSGKALGFALLASVTLDGIPENVALGVTLVGGGSPALLVAVFTSNLPEALAGSARMRGDGLSKLACVSTWAGASGLLAAAVVVGRLSSLSATHDALALPLAFAGGAVLASVAATLAPEAFRGGGPWTSLATAAGFALGTHLAIGSGG